MEAWWCVFLDRACIAMNLDRCLRIQIQKYAHPVFCPWAVHGLLGFNMFKPGIPPCILRRRKLLCWRQQVLRPYLTLGPLCRFRYHRNNADDHGLSARYKVYKDIIGIFRKIHIPDNQFGSMCPVWSIFHVLWHSRRHDNRRIYHIRGNEFLSVVLI